MDNKDELGLTSEEKIAVEHATGRVSPNLNPTVEMELARVNAELRKLELKKGDILTIIIKEPMISDVQMKYARDNFRNYFMDKYGVDAVVVNGDVAFQLHRPTTQKVIELESKIAKLEDEVVTMRQILQKCDYTD